MEFGFEYIITLWAWTAVIFALVFTLDDLFIDVVALFKRLKPRAMNIETLSKIKHGPEGKVAIMIANWKEAEVLGPMIKGNIRGIKYGNYTFFLGVYPNDLATWAKASDLSQQFPDKVVVVVNSHQGPTSKGQMLNEIAARIVQSEKETGVAYDYFLMQDSEDVLHPHSLSLLNYYGQDADFTQIPVFSFDVSLKSFVGGTYLDEFSEVHTKDLLVREALGAAIPSAGVGTFMSRRLISELMLHQDGGFLREDSLTEDYQLGMTVKKLGYRSQFLCVELTDEKGHKDFIATREYFPSKFTASVRQKSRWTLGITYQGLQHLGWQGTAIDRYFLFRDRRGPINSVLIVFSLLLMFALIAFRAIYGALPDGLDNVVFGSLVAVNMFNMLFRLVQRMRSVHRVYGFAQVFQVPLRWLVANTVNVCASYRAHRTFGESLRTGQRPQWVKTDHELPAQFGQDVEVQL
ncbi:bacteriophage N4 adsorption protein B [compost metagenome]